MAMRLDISNTLPLIPIVNMYWVVKNTSGLRRIGLLATIMAGIASFYTALQYIIGAYAYLASVLTYSILLWRAGYRYWPLVIPAGIIPFTYPVVLLIASRGPRAPSNSLIRISQYLPSVRGAWHY
mgnify:CR=1 FL=1